MHNGLFILSLKKRIFRRKKCQYIVLLLYRNIWYSDMYQITKSWYWNRKWFKQQLVLQKFSLWSLIPARTEDLLHKHRWPRGISSYMCVCVCVCPVDLHIPPSSAGMTYSPPLTQCHLLCLSQQGELTRAPAEVISVDTGGEGATVWATPPLPRLARRVHPASGLSHPFLLSSQHASGRSLGPSPC